MAIIDPEKPKGQHVLIVPSLQQGAELLTQMRRERSARSRVAKPHAKRGKHGGRK
jgi:hypothetical protein